MGTVIAIISTIIAIGGLLGALGHAGYLYMLGSTAKKRPGGEPIAAFARSRYGIAAGATVAGVIAVLLAGSGFSGILAIVLGIGTAAYSTKALQASRERLRLGGSAE